MTSSGSSEAGVPASAAAPAIGRVVAVVKDLFFVARIRETARTVGVSLDFARDVPALETALAQHPRLILLDLTGDFDYEALFAALDRAQSRRPPVLAYTTHALARQTQPWHSRCERVVTKETLTQELAGLLSEGLR